MKSPVYLLWAGGLLLLSAAGWMTIWPEWTLHPLGLPDYTPAAFALVGLLRLRAAHRHGRVLAAARSQTPLILPRDGLPQRRAHTYLGHGFQWTRTHAQRLHELTRRGLDVQEGDASELGGRGLVHAVGGDQRDRPLMLSNQQLAQHTLILGTTGVGKTRLFELLITQAIARGEAVVVIDPKGDEDLLGRVVEQCRRGVGAGTASKGLDRFLLFAPPYPAHSASYDPLRNRVRVSEIPDRIAPLIPGGGAAEPFRKFAWGAVNVIAHALADWGAPINLTQIRGYCLDDTWALVRDLLVHKAPHYFHGEAMRSDEQIEENALRWLNLVEQGKLPDSEALRRLIALARRPRENYQKMTNSLIPILDSLSSGPMRDLLSPERSDLDWRRVAAERQVVYLFLGSMLGYETANAVAKMALMDFQAYVGATYAYRKAEHYTPINVFVDELSNVVTPEFINLLNKGRGAGVRITMAAQTGSDLEAALGSRAMAEQVIGNANTVIQLRAQSYRDARSFSDLCGQRSIDTTRSTATVRPAFGLTGKRDVADFEASYGLQQQEVDVDLVSPSAVMDLPVGQFFGRWQGRVFKGRIPLLDTTPRENYLVTLGVKS